MRICSVTLAGPGTEAIIGDALQSADWVDSCLVIDTGIREFGIDEGFVENGPPIVHASMMWRDDFSYMRNMALDCPMDADWMIWLDTDERLICPDPAALRKILADYPQVNVISAMHVSGEYAKDRMIRLPRAGKYIGPVHEWYEQDDNSIPVLRLPPDILTFDELARDKTATRAKLERDKRILNAEVRRDRDNPRWKFYLGQTYDHLGDTKRALRWWYDAIYEPCPDGWDEMRAWSAFRSAETLTKTDPDEAISIALAGLRLFPQMPELLWVLGAAHMEKKQPSHALTWAMMALAIVQFDKAAPAARSGFRWPPAFGWAPLEIAAVAFRDLGMLKEAHDATAAVERMKGESPPI